MDVVYTDFSKAFDQVVHRILLAKLKGFGFGNHLLQWLQSYLTDRSQIVVIGGEQSERIVPSSGVVQGSILGPLLFVLFINDLLTSLSSSSAFADDLKVFRKINDVTDCHILQREVSKIVEWCNKNRMSLNVKKCAVLSITHKPQKTMFDYHIQNEILERVTTIKDLGVIIDEKMSFEPHVNYICRKAYRMLGFIFRCGKYFSNRSTMLLLYNTLVRSSLEYCTTVWNPIYLKYKDCIERVQRKFTRMYYYKFNMMRPDYDQRLQLLHIHSLEQRRLENDEILLYKIIHKLIDTSLFDQLSFHPHVRPTRHESTRTFYLPNISTNIQQNSPLFRIQYNHDRYFSDFNLFDHNFARFKRSVRNFSINEH